MLDRGWNLEERARKVDVCLDGEKRAGKIETDNIIVINYTVVWNVAIVI